MNSYGRLVIFLSVLTSLCCSGCHFYKFGMRCKNESKQEISLILPGISDRMLLQPGEEKDIWEAYFWGSVPVCVGIQKSDRIAEYVIPASRPSSTEVDFSDNNYSHIFLFGLQVEDNGRVYLVNPSKPGPKFFLEEVTE